MTLLPDRARQVNTRARARGMPLTASQSPGGSIIEIEQSRIMQRGDAGDAPQSAQHEAMSGVAAELVEHARPAAAMHQRRIHHRNSLGCTAEPILAGDAAVVMRREAAEQDIGIAGDPVPL